MLLTPVALKGNIPAVISSCVQHCQSGTRPRLARALVVYRSGIKDYGNLPMRKLIRQTRKGLELVISELIGGTIRGLSRGCGQWRSKKF